MVNIEPQFVEFITKAVDNITSKNTSVIYSCVTNNYDKDLIINNKLDGVDYIVFKDVKSELVVPDFVNIIEFDFFFKNPRFTNRVFKILPHLFLKKYNRSLYVDANVQVLDLKNFLKNDDSNFDFILFNHDKRNCLYKEADECIFWGKDDPKKIHTQKDFYKSQGFDENLGLYMGRVLLRNHNNLKEFSELWWDHLNKFSGRDQISLAFLINTVDVKFKSILKNNFNDYFKVIQHSKEIHYTNNGFLINLKRYLLMFLVKIKNII
tara:strand:+ start:3214 stop:4008 length:795 start_codon:yes stop_codon:yes gene_type:complete